MPFLIILILLLSYTSFKATEIWPSEPALAGLLSIPLFLLMVGGALIYRSRPSVFEKKWYQVLSWVGSFVMGVWSTFIFISLPIDILRFIFSVIQGAGEAATTLPSASVLFSQGLAIGLLVLSGALAGLGFLEVLRGPKLLEVKIPIDNLPRSLQGLRIVQLSDLHIGHAIGKVFIQNIVERTNAARPDLVFITGDIADAKASSILEALKPLGDIKARYGVYYVTGNHEYYWGATDLIAAVQKLGIVPLLNENRVIQVGGDKIMIAGVTDPMGGRVFADHRPDLAKALQASENVSLKLLLAHRPGVCDEAEGLGVNVQFSGHTHAGQYFPFNLVIGFFHKYYRGLNKHGRLWVYVNTGTGYWGPANRFAVSSEITLATLVKA